MIDKIFFDDYDGQACYLFVLNGDGIEVGITDFGAAVQFIKIKTKNGIKDVALGYATIKERIQSGTYCGATIGRVANRIKNSEFTLNGQKYTVSSNDGNNCNHGGINGFDQRLFKPEISGDILRLTLFSPDGDQGFPGNFKLTVEYELKRQTLEVRYFAESDKDTLWSPTCHPYFNLNGEDSGNIFDTVLKINAETITLPDKDNIPSGETAFVAGTPFDFTKPQPIGAVACRGGLSVCDGGYDINYVLNGTHAASAFSTASGIKLDLYTDLPGLQFYTGYYLRGNGKTKRYVPKDGFCLEPQFFPNAVNIKNFASPAIKANTVNTHYIKYNFSLIK